MGKRKTVEVEGVEFSVIAEKLGGWHVFNLLREVRTADDDYAKVSILLEIACYITGMTEDEFISACGGDDAQVSQVVSIATGLITQAYPKN